MLSVFVKIVVASIDAIMPVLVEDSQFLESVLRDSE